MMSSDLSPGLIGGSMYAKLKALVALTTMRQYPSLRSTLKNKNGMPVSGTWASVCMMQGMTLPSLYMECCGARVLSEALFTDWSGFPLTLSANARLRIILYVHDVWNYSRLAGGLCLIVDPMTSLQHPSLTHSSASALHAFAGVGCLGTWVCSAVHGVLNSCKSTGQPW